MAAFSDCHHPYPEYMIHSVLHCIAVNQKVVVVSHHFARRREYKESLYLGTHACITRGVVRAETITMANISLTTTRTAFECRCVCCWCGFVAHSQVNARRRANGSECYTPNIVNQNRCRSLLLFRPNEARTYACHSARGINLAQSLRERVEPCCLPVARHCNVWLSTLQSVTCACIYMSHRMCSLCVFA